MGGWLVVLWYIDGLAQYPGNSIANALELSQSYANPSMMPFWADNDIYLVWWSKNPSNVMSFPSCKVTGLLALQYTCEVCYTKLMSVSLPVMSYTNLSAPCVMQHVWKAGACLYMLPCTCFLSSALIGQMYMTWLKHVTLMCGYVNFRMKSPPQIRYSSRFFMMLLLI